MPDWLTFVSWIDLSNVGVSNKVEKADLNSVKERLAMLKRKKENPQKEEYSKYSLDQAFDIVFTQWNSLDLDERLAAIKQQEEEERMKRKERKKQKKEHKKKSDGATENEAEDEMAKMMGFSGFGSSKA